MIAALQDRTLENHCSSTRDQFLAMLPQIRRQASLAFRGLRAELREELIQEVIANAYQAWVGLVHQGKEAVAFPTPLAQFAIRQVCAGRRVGSSTNSLDILSRNARRARGLTVESLDQLDSKTGTLNHLLIEDRHAGPAETATARMDMRAWLGTLSRQQRRIANALALGETTNVVARKFGVSPARISQLRLRFRQLWEQFQAGTKPAGCPA